jgi:hypothetical protein
LHTVMQNQTSFSEPREYGSTCTHERLTPFTCRSRCGAGVLLWIKRRKC